MLQKEAKEGKKDKDGDKEDEDSGRHEDVINQHTAVDVEHFATRSVLNGLFFVSLFNCSFLYMNFFFYIKGESGQIKRMSALRFQKFNFTNLIARGKPL